MAYTETCMENLLPAGVFLRTAVLELGRQLIVVTAPADGILVAVSSSRSAGRRMLPPNTLHLHEPPTLLLGGVRKPFELRRYRALAGLFLRREPPKD